MRLAAKVDANQKQIVEGLRKLGCSVTCLHSVGKGCPDLLVGFESKNYLMEVKDGAKVQSQRKLTKDQEVWHDSWKGQVAVVETLEKAIAIIEHGRII